DFVEAALMRRSGAKVCLAHDLEGSYEECPPTLIDYAQRDQRWCQGNMQHLRLVFSSGFHPVSRIHLGMGAMSYMSSPLWLLFLGVRGLVGAWVAVSNEPGRASEAAVGGEWAAGLFIATMALLLLPRLWSYLLMLGDRRQLAACGGAGKAAMSIALETAVSVLV